MDLPQAIMEAKDIDGWMLLEELQWIYEQAQKAKVIIEVGVYHGRTTKVLAGPGRKVYSIEPFVSLTDEMFKWHCGKELEVGQIELIKATSEEAVPILKKRRIKADMIFIDGNHFDPVIDHDIRIYQQFMRKGGLFCGHDLYVDFPDVEKALKNYLPGYALAGAGTIWFKGM